MRWLTRGRSVILLGILAMTLVCGLGPVRRAVLQGAGQALVVHDAIQQADVIVVPEWAGLAGAIEAGDLVQEGIADRVAVLSEASDPAERELDRRGVVYRNSALDLVETLRALGVKTIEIIPNDGSGSDGEGRVLPLWCDVHKFQTVVVVSSPDHSRRIRRVLHRSMGGHLTKVTIRSSRYSSFDPEHWWQTHSGARTGITEIAKLLLDMVLHPIS